jgi:hypothetical protein
VTIVGQDPPVGLTGNYHLATGSPAINKGPTYSNYPAAQNASSILAPTVDIDGQARPATPTPLPFDLGADEVQ